MSYNANGDLTKATLAYIPIVGLILFIIEKEDNYVRYHSMQSILLNVAEIIIGIVLWILTMIFANPYSLSTYLYGGWGFMAILSTIIWLAWLAVTIFCMMKAYKGAWFKLPIIGDIAMNIVNK
ncbi:MAG: DUF4870 domain-containing protein [Bacillota bacterium]